MLLKGAAIKASDSVACLAHLVVAQALHDTIAEVLAQFPGEFFPGTRKRLDHENTKTPKWGLPAGHYPIDLCRVLVFS